MIMDLLPGKGTIRLVVLFKATDLIRFAKKTEPAGECWRWTGYTDSKGYGQFWFNGMAWWAHRWSYAIFAGDIPDHETVDHVCRNPWCVNPKHLRVMSRVENTEQGNHHRRVDAGLEEPVEGEKVPF